MNIVFNEEKHEYIINGEVYPSVTQIIGAAGLINSTWFTEESRIRGSHVHQICQWIDDGVIDRNSIDESYKGYIDAYEKFLEEVKPEWLFVEHKIACTHNKYAGTFDRSGIIFGKNSILDIKTGPSSPNTGVQLSAYADAFDKRMKRYGLYLNKEGSYKLESYTDYNDLKIFKMCCNLWHWKQLKGVK